MQKKLIENLLIENRKELRSILEFWVEKSVDRKNGGFVGQINKKGEPVDEAKKGLILNARILWTFSRAYRFWGDKKYLQLAKRAYDYFIDYFWDNKNGGVFWAVDFCGNVTSNRKQIYGQAFGIYALSEYYRATGNKESLNYSIEIFRLIETYSFDKKHGGYIEAFTSDWKTLADFRLSEKDANYPKSMNTHLHILESYSNLYRVWKNDALKEQITGLIHIFLNQIIHSKTHHFALFFERDWSVPLNLVSYGHDIEGAWLINEAARLIDNNELFAKTKKRTKKMVDAVLEEGMYPDGSSVIYEKNEDSGEYNKERHWWVQAEAMVGLLDAFKNSGNKNYFETYQRVWSFIKDSIIDYKYGGWYDVIEEDGTVRNTGLKGGFWVCPYHNSRALIETSLLLEKING